MPSCGATSRSRCSTPPVAGRWPGLAGLAPGWAGLAPSSRCAAGSVRAARCQRRAGGQRPLGAGLRRRARQRCHVATRQRPGCRPDRLQRGRPVRQLQQLHSGECDLRSPVGLGLRGTERCTLRPPVRRQRRLPRVPGPHHLAFCHLAAGYGSGFQCDDAVDRQVERRARHLLDPADVQFWLNLPQGVSVQSASGASYATAEPETGSAVMMLVGVAMLLTSRYRREHIELPPRM